MNKTTIPQQPDRTRDLGVSTEPHDHVRPPYAAALDALRALEFEHGTAAFVEAMRHMNGDPAFNARRFDAQPDNTRTVLAIAGPELRSRLERNLAAAVRTHRAYPGTKAA